VTSLWARKAEEGRKEGRKEGREKLVSVTRGAEEIVTYFAKVN
jgi:hypothetical protein